MKYCFSLLIYLYIPFCSFGQQSKLYNVINKDHQIIEKLFNDILFFDKCDNGCPPFFEIESVDTLSLSLYKRNKEFIETVYIIKIEVNFKNANFANLPISSEKRIKMEKYDYYILSCNHTFYRLFGFYSTDINLFLRDVGNEGLLSLSEYLKKFKILTNNESKYFVKSIKKEKREYYSKINKPCILLQNYFTREKQDRNNTIILPLEPLIPFSVN